MTFSGQPQDNEWMLQALALAERAVGATSPNPPVGAVLVKDGQRIGAGFTQPAGGNHAEVEAIDNARAVGHDLTGTTMFVTLEPCGHDGRTPPCTEAILGAGVKRVVVGTIDNNPLMLGSSLEYLRRSGVEVTLGVQEPAASKMVRGFSRSISCQLPEVTCKVATSLDGKIATQLGESQWITGEDARQHGHGLRATHDAILVGVNTVISDNPRLTCRTQTGRDPVPVVLDTNLRVPADALIFNGVKSPIVICSREAPERDLPCEIVRAVTTNGVVDIEAALSVLARRGLHRVLVEGGAAIHRSVLDSGLVDVLCVYLAGVTIPGGRPWLGGTPLESLQVAPRLGRPEVEVLGDDLLLTYELRHRLDPDINNLGDR